MLSEAEAELNQWLKDLGRIGGQFFGGSMFMLKPDSYQPIPYTCRYGFDFCLDCWVRYGGSPYVWINTDSHQCK